MEQQHEPTPSFNPARDIIRAPWTDAQVTALNEYQRNGNFHPYTSDTHELIATRDGWVETIGGPVVQDWAHAASADLAFVRAYNEFSTGNISRPKES